MQCITLTSADSICDFDYGEGWVTFCWRTSIGLDASLTIDLDGHCSREMPIRSGSGVTIVDISRNTVVLQFDPALASKLELDPVVQFAFPFDDSVHSDIERLASLL